MLNAENDQCIDVASKSFNTHNAGKAMKHCTLLLLLLIAPFTLLSQELEERIMRDVKQHGYFVEIQDTMGVRMIGLRDREPIRDPETFVSAFFVWKPQHPQAPQPKSGGWILLMAKVAEIKKGGQYECEAYRIAATSDVSLFCAAYNVTGDKSDPELTTVNLVHRIDLDAYDAKEFMRILTCMREEWRKWSQWR